jgi:hypothetical protein
MQNCNITSQFNSLDKLLTSETTEKFVFSKLQADLLNILKSDDVWESRGTAQRILNLLKPSGNFTYQQV